MNFVHLHLLINHLPIIGTAIGFIVLLTGILLKSKVTQRTGLLIATFAAIAAFPTMFSGDQAEHLLENSKEIDMTFVEAHEHAAELYIKIVIGAGIVSLITFIFTFGKSKLTQVLSWITILSLAASMAFSFEVGSTGGEIRHTEIRKIKSLLPAEASTEHENSGE
jgi:uncharacterized membrane protein